MLPDPRQLEEVLVAPDDLPGIGPEDHDWQRGIDKGGLTGGVHVARHVVNILQDALAALFVAADEIGVQRHGGNALRQGQRGADGDGSQGEGQETEEIKL